MNSDLPVCEYREVVLFICFQTVKQKEKKKKTTKNIVMSKLMFTFARC